MKINFYFKIGLLLYPIRFGLKIILRFGLFIFSGSMEPAFQRGDLLFLTNYKEDPIRVGEIVVFKVEGREIPIVHRVLKIHEKQVFSSQL